MITARDLDPQFDFMRFDDSRNVFKIFSLKWMDIYLICRFDFGYILYEGAFKLMYASLYCDLQKFFDVPVWAQNLPLIGDLQTADVITTGTLFNLFAGLGSLLSNMMLNENIISISNGDDNDQSVEEE